jgi:invasion protein IalB
MLKPRDRQGESMTQLLSVLCHRAQIQEFVQTGRRDAYRTSSAATSSQEPTAIMRCFLVLTLAAFFLCSAAPPGRTQGAVKAKHGDWELRCETPPGAMHEQCALLQSVTAEDRPNVNLSVIVLKTADGKNRLLRVIAPLGVLLPSGLGLKIDNTDVGRAGFVRCLPIGCVAEVVMEDKLVQSLKIGHNATFIIFQTPEEGIGIPLDLKGFAEGFDALP